MNKPNKTCHGNKCKEVSLSSQRELFFKEEYVGRRERIANFSYSAPRIPYVNHAIPKEAHGIERRGHREAGVQALWSQWSAGSLQYVAAKGIFTKVVLPEHG